MSQYTFSIELDGDYDWALIEHYYVKTTGVKPVRNILNTRPLPTNIPETLKKHAAITSKKKHELLDFFENFRNAFGSLPAAGDRIDTGKELIGIRSRTFTMKNGQLSCHLGICLDEHHFTHYQAVE